MQIQYKIFKNTIQIKLQMAYFRFFMHFKSSSMDDASSTKQVFWSLFKSAKRIKKQIKKIYHKIELELRKITEQNLNKNCN